MHACPIDKNMKIDKYASCNLPTEDPISNLKAFNQDGYENDTQQYDKLLPNNRQRQPPFP